MRACSATLFEKLEQRQLLSLAGELDPTFGKSGWVVPAGANQNGGTSNDAIVQSDSNGHVDYSSAVVHTAQVEREISSSASAKLSFAVKVRCPDLLEAVKGTKFHCQATDARGNSKTVTVTALSAQGGFHYDLG